MLSAALLALAPTPTHPDAIATPVQCEVALEYAKKTVTSDLSAPIVFSDGYGYDFAFSAPGINPSYLSGGWNRYENGQRVEVPSPPEDVVRGLLQNGAENALPRCENLKTWLRARKVGFGAKALKAVRARSKNDELPAGIFFVGLPSVSGDGRVALLYTSDIWGGEAAGGHVEMYERQPDGSWKFAATLRLWIS